MPLQETNFKVNLSYGNEYLQDENAEANNLMFIFWGILIPIIGIIGIVGNILTMIVLFRREMKSITVYFLRTLVVTDTAIILVAILGLSLISITQRNPAMWRFSDVAYPKMYTPVNFFVMTLQMINVWATVAVSLERYIAICFPFRSINICTKRNAYLVIGIIVAFSVVYNIPRCFATTHSACKGVHECYSLITTSFGVTVFYEKVYMVYLYLILIYILPLAALGILNTLLILELMRMQRRRTVSNVHENSEANMSLVLVLIVVVFICCQSPGLVAQFTFLEKVALLKWICVSNTLVVVNSSVNFLIYTAVGQKFRKVLFKVFQAVIKRPVIELKSTYSQNGGGRGTEMTRLTSQPPQTVPEIRNMASEEKHTLTAIGNTSY